MNKETFEIQVSWDCGLYPYDILYVNESNSAIVLSKISLNGGTITHLKLYPYPKSKYKIVVRFKLWIIKLKMYFKIL